MTKACSANPDGLHRQDYTAATPRCVDCGRLPSPCEPGSPQWLLNVARFEEHRRRVLDERVYTVAGYFDDRAFYVFSIGLARSGRPEIVVTTPDSDMGARAVSEVADLIADTDRELKGGDVVDLRDRDGRVVMEYRLIELPDSVTRDSELFNQAHGLVGERRAIRALQAVWPGRHVSTEEGASLSFPTVAAPWNDQPLLAEPWWDDADAASQIDESVS